VQLNLTAIVRHILQSAFSVVSSIKSTLLYYSDGILAIYIENETRANVGHIFAISLQVSESTNEIMILGSRREWVQASSRQSRTFYAATFHVDPERSSRGSSPSEEASEGVPLPEDDRFVDILDSSNKPNWMPTPTSIDGADIQSSLKLIRRLEPSFLQKPSFEPTTTHVHLLST
jgi:hypothetical protein